MNYTYYPGEDYYSDGDVEDQLLEICKSGKIREALKESSSWPILYHLSPTRENLLEWYDFGKGASLLEIGSGCGALTGLFVDRADRVVCIELSRRRSTINAYKNGNRGSAEIYVGNFQDVQLSERFDYVTLIGVLEYSKLYVNGSRPFDRMLARVKEYLKPGGRLMIAIENKMGLKYFSGAAEDHTGRPFDGLNGYVRGESAETFSRQGLQRLLSRNGFTNTEFYYPMPDYKLPFVIYSDDFLPEKGDLRGMKSVYSGINYNLFDEERLFDDICEDGQFPYFANSFLVVAKNDETSDLQ